MKKSNPNVVFCSIHASLSIFLQYCSRSTSPSQWIKTSESPCCDPPKGEQLLPGRVYTTSTPHPKANWNTHFLRGASGDHFHFICTIRTSIFANVRMLFVFVGWRHQMGGSHKEPKAVPQRSSYYQVGKKAAKITHIS